MGKITIEYDEEELKRLIVEILTERLLNSLPQSSKHDIMRKAKFLAEQQLADKIMHELDSA